MTARSAAAAAGGSSSATTRSTPPRKQRGRIVLIVIVIVGCSIVTVIMNSRLLVLHGVLMQQQPSPSSSLLAPTPPSNSTTQAAVAEAGASRLQHPQQQEEEIRHDDENEEGQRHPTQQRQHQEEEELEEDNETNRRPSQQKHQDRQEEEEEQQHQKLQQQQKLQQPPLQPKPPKQQRQQQQEPIPYYKPYLILHVGPPKTATTTIQCNLEKYSNLLVEFDNVYFIGASCDHAITYRRQHSRPNGGGGGGGGGIGGSHQAATNSQQHGMIRHNFTMINGITPPLVNPLLYAIGYKGEHKLTKQQLEKSHQPMYDFQTFLDYHHTLNHSIVYSVEQFSKRLPHTKQVYDRINTIFNTSRWNVHVISTYRRYYDWLYSNYYQDNHVNLYTNQWYKYKGGKNGEKSKEFRSLTPTFLSIVEKHVSVYNGSVAPPKKGADSLAYGEHLALRAYRRYNEYLNTNIGGRNFKATAATTTTTRTTIPKKAHVKLFDYHYQEDPANSNNNDLFTNFVCQMLTPAARNICQYLLTHNDHADLRNATSHRRSDHDVIDSARLAEVSYKRLFVVDNDNGNNNQKNISSTTPLSTPPPTILKQDAMSLLQTLVIDPIVASTSTTTTTNNSTDGNDQKKNRNKLHSEYFICDYPKHLKEQFLALSVQYQQEFLKYTTTATNRTSTSSSSISSSRGGGDDDDSMQHYYYNYDETKRVEMIRTIFQENFNNGKYCEIDPHAVFDDPKWNQVIKDQVYQIRIHT